MSARFCFKYSAPFCRDFGCYYYHFFVLLLLCFFLHKSPLSVRSYQSALGASIINNYFFIIFILTPPRESWKVGAINKEPKMFGIKKLKKEVADLKLQNGILQGIIERDCAKRSRAAKQGWSTRKAESAVLNH